MASESQMWDGTCASLFLTSSGPLADFTVRQQIKTGELVAGNKLWYGLKDQHSVLRIFGLIMVPLNMCWPKILWFKGTTMYYRTERFGSSQIAHCWPALWTEMFTDLLYSKNCHQWRFWKLLTGIKTQSHRTTNPEYSQEIRITAFFPVEKSYFWGNVWKFTQMSLLTFLSVNLLLNDLWEETFQPARPRIRDVFLP